jgi:hypothetical protein
MVGDRQHDERRDRVRPHEPRRHDHQAGDGGGDEGEQVVEDVLEGAFHVQARPIGPAEQPGGRKVDHDADQGGGPRDAVELRRQDLGAFEAVREAAARRPGGQLHRHEREHDRCRVGEHVAGIGDERQRARDEPDDHLARHEGDEQYQRPDEIPPIGVHRNGMPVPVTVAVAAANARAGFF